jgi:hypothetical protein
MTLGMMCPKASPIAESTMKNWMLLGAMIYLGGCASHGCNDSFNESHLTDSKCRADHLLYQNDMLQAKLLLSENDRKHDELTMALLQRAAKQDASGEAEFYEAVLLIRQHGDQQKIVDLLQDAADRKHPLAIALLTQQLSMTDQKKSARYRAEYDQLDVAKSGYPSFEQAVQVLNELIAPAS